MNYLKKILDLLTPHERKKGVLLLCMISVMALLDVLGVASILPFIAVLANPGLVETNRFLNTAYEQLGFNNPQYFLFSLGVLVFILLVFSLAFKTLTVYAQMRFTLMREYSIGKRLVEGYLQQPYSWFLSRHSADLGKNILSQVGSVVYHAIIPMLNLISQGLVAVFLLILLILIDPKLAIVVGVTIALAYTLIFKASRGFLQRIGQEQIKLDQKRFTVLSEAFGASKEVKVGGLEQTYIQRFSLPARTYANNQATTQVISQLPRFALEAIAFGGLMLVILYLMAQSGGFSNALPIITLYAFSGYRLMPALQQIYGAVTQLRFAGPALDALHADLMSLGTGKADGQNQEIIILNQGIALKNVNFRYPNSANSALKNISIEIPAKSIVGLVGATGSGKTTTVDLILGLLEAEEGTLEVDGTIINQNNTGAWQRTIGYVPQQIYLADDTIAANIAFGIDSKDIDYTRVQRAAKIANLHDFVLNQLPQQYKTTIGERGVRLSGGQRQRIGIARALYNNPQVLVLDEATSALDNLTELAVMEAVNNLGHEITIILIAHRLSTVKACDTIFLLENGEVKAKGSYLELTEISEQFRLMAKGNN